MPAATTLTDKETVARALTIPSGYARIRLGIKLHPTAHACSPDSKDGLMLIETAAKLTASYSDAKSGEVTVKFGKIAFDRTITVTLPQKSDMDKLRVGNAEKKSKNTA